jgi:hypothetical protein
MRRAFESSFEVDQVPRAGRQAIPVVHPFPDHHPVSAVVTSVRMRPPTRVNEFGGLLIFIKTKS